MFTLFLSYVSCLVAPRPLQAIDAAVSLYGMSGSGFGGWLPTFRPTGSASAQQLGGFNVAQNSTSIIMSFHQENKTTLVP
jgi:hypothetical protein